MGVRPIDVPVACKDEIADIAIRSSGNVLRNAKRTGSGHPEDANLAGWQETTDAIKNSWLCFNQVFGRVTGSIPGETVNDG